MKSKKSWINAFNEELKQFLTFYVFGIDFLLLLDKKIYFFKYWKFPIKFLTLSLLYLKIKC